MRRASILLIACIGAALSSQAGAQPSGLDVYEPMELPAFLSTYRCAVVERLQLIHDDRDAETNRFLVIALKSNPQSYVQCVFLDKDRRMLCEASSGFYAQLPVMDRSLRMSEAGLEMLARLGFSTDDSDGNFQRMIEIRSREHLIAVADLILTTLYEVYGARVGSHLEWVSPLAKVDAQSSGCTPIG